MTHGSEMPTDILDTGLCEYLSEISFRIRIHHYQIVFRFLHQLVPKKRVEAFGVSFQYDFPNLRYPNDIYVMKRGKGENESELYEGVRRAYHDQGGHIGCLIYIQ